MKRLIHLSVWLVLACSAGERVDNSGPAPPSIPQSHAYTTDFPNTENPVSDGGRWLNGGSNGGDWTDVSSSARRAIGHQVEASYTDATAILKGPWGSDQRAAATVFTTAALDGDCYSEVELRLRSSISLHSNRGYEVSFKVSEAETAYLIIVRWNGRLGDFTYLFRGDGKAYGVKNGDAIEATVVGTAITAYKNGVKVGQATDNVFADGSPGIGFNLENAKPGCRGTNDRYGFSSFSAADVISP